MAGLMKDPREMGMWEAAKMAWYKKKGLLDHFNRQQGRQQAMGLVGKKQTPYELDESQKFDSTDSAYQALQRGLPSTNEGLTPEQNQQILAQNQASLDRPGLMNKGTGLLGGEINPAEFYGGLMSTQGYEGMGAAGLQNMQNQRGLMDRAQAALGAGFKNVTQDDRGNWYGVRGGNVEQIPMQGDSTFTKYKTVQSVDPSGRTSIELVSPALLDNAGQPRIKVGSKGFSGEQTQASTYGNRMFKGTQVIDKLFAAGFDASNIADAAKGKVPLGNYLTSPEYKKYDQAKWDWIRAKLRKESGAVINKDEFSDEDTTYFPQIGDDEGVIAQKARARWIATQGMIKQSQGAFKSQNKKSYTDFSKYDPIRVQKKNAALEWARENPDDPRAAAVLKKAGKM